MRVNLDGSSWRAIDPESVTNSEGGIQHGASIVQNFRAIGEDAMHLIPNRMFIGSVAAIVEKGGFFDAVGAFFIGAIWDALDIATFPFMLAKNLIDATAHGVAWVANQIKGESDGTATAVEPFSYLDSDSAARLVWQYDKRSRTSDEDLVPLFNMATAEAHFHRLHGQQLVVANQQLENFNGQVKWTMHKAYRPGPSINDLSAVMLDIKKTMPNGVKIKAGGSRHSFAAASTDGVYIHPEGMKFVETMPSAGAADDVLRPDVVGREGLIQMGAGVTIRQANIELWQRGRSLPVLGGYDGQTLAGGLSTGTHGAVLSQAPLAAMVRSIDLVRPDGKQVRIEPTQGITDPVKFHRQHPKMRLIQNDSVFGAAQINLGALGVIHSYILSSVPRFYLREHHSQTSTTEAKRLLANGNVYHLMENGDMPAWVGKDKGIRLPDQEANLYSLCLCFNPYTGTAQFSGTTKFDLKTEPFDLGRRVDRQLLNAAPRGEYARPVLDNWVLDQFPPLVGLVTNGIQAVLPKAVPDLIETSVTGSYTYKNRGYNVFFSGNFTADVPARFCEFFVPLKGDLYLKAIDILQRAAKTWSAKTGQYQTGPMNMRFIKGIQAQLGRQDDVASFECLFSGAPGYAGDMINYYRQCLQAELGNQVSMHFGQEAPGITNADIAREFPQSPSWRHIRNRFDPKGQMLNAQQEQLFAPVQPSTAALGPIGALRAN